jgi:hypothetical protein
VDWNGASVIINNLEIDILYEIRTHLFVDQQSCLSELSILKPSILDKVFLCLITCYRSEVINGANVRQAHFGILLDWLRDGKRNLAYLFIR